MASGKSPLLCALDSEGRRHLLVPLGEREEALRDVKSRGVKVVTEELIVRGQAERRYINLRCEDSAGHQVFDFIGGEIAAALLSEGTNRAKIIAQVLAKWRRFWGQPPIALLTREELMGLFAELWFLSFWLSPRVDSAEAVRRWRGPYGARHDFEWTKVSVEVKATASSRGRIHHINGLDQLEPPENGELFLFSLRLREEGGATKTLPSMVSTCKQQLGADLDATSQLDAALMQAGYSPVHDEEYAKVRLHVVDEGLFAVKDQFPRLLGGSFLAGVPNGIEHVEYDVNLNTFASLLLATRPDQASML
jgi:hypothetical protein